MNKKDTAAEAVPARFEVDLTSVCVRVGAVQLPFRLQNTFQEGPVTAHDAAEASLLELEFRAPRKLVGLGDFFATHGLRSNDRIALVFEEDGLQIEAIRRERSSASKAAKTRFARALGSDVDRLGERSGLSGSAGAAGGTDGSAVPTATASTRHHGTDALNASDSDEQRQRTPSQARPTPEPGRNRIVRERIRGNAPPLMTRPDLDAGFQRGAASVTVKGSKHGEAKRGSNALNGVSRWVPLDVMAPPDGWPEIVEGDLREAARAHGHVIVREVRRSRLGAARPLTPTQAADAAVAGEASDRASGSGTTATATDVSTRFTNNPADRDAQQAEALQRVLDRRSRPRDVPEEASGASPRQHTATAHEGSDQTGSSTAYGAPADARRDQRSAGQASMPWRTVAAPVAVTRSLHQRPITRTAPLQRGSDRVLQDEQTGSHQSNDGIIQESDLTGYRADRGNVSAEPATAWGPVDRLEPVRVGQGGVGRRSAWTAATQPLLQQVRTGLKRSSAPEGSGDQGAMMARMDAPLNADAQSPRDARVGHEANSSQGNDRGTPRDEAIGRALDLFGLRKRLRRGRNVDEVRARDNGGQAMRDDDHGSARAGISEHTVEAVARLDEDVLFGDEALRSNLGSPGSTTDDFSDAFLEFDEEHKGVGGRREEASGRTRPWLSNGEYRPTDASPWRPGGHIAKLSPADSETQESGIDDEARQGETETSRLYQRAQEPIPAIGNAKAPTASGAVTSANPAKGASRSQQKKASRVASPAVAPAIPATPDEPELPRATGGRHAATKGYYDLSRLNEADSRRGGKAPTEPARGAGGPGNGADIGPVEGSSGGPYKGLDTRPTDVGRTSQAPQAEDALQAQKIGPNALSTPTEPAAATTSPTHADPPMVVAGATTGAKDVVVIESYLARPDVPAIVRSEAMADNIGMPLDRVERVMMRISEDRERVTRIRPGAYLVRRKPTPQLDDDDGTIGPNA